MLGIDVGNTKHRYAYGIGVGLAFVHVIKNGEIVRMYGPDFTMKSDGMPTKLGELFQEYFWEFSWGDTPPICEDRQQAVYIKQRIQEAFQEKHLDLN